MNIKSTILVVDDDPHLLNVIEDILRSADYNVLKTNSGSEALDILEKEHIHLILADIIMPGMDGYQLFNEVNKNPQWLNTPFVFLSARSLDSDIQFGKELGVDDYITKPVQVDDLLAIIRGKLKRAWNRRISIIDYDNQNVTQNNLNHLKYGNIKVNLHNHQVRVNDNPVHLSTLEFRLFVKLLEQPGSVIPHQDLVKATHQLETDQQDASQLLRPLIRSLRRKLGYQKGNMGCIENLRGIGYQISPPP